jgi:hypothetical protein
MIEEASVLVLVVWHVALYDSRGPLSPTPTPVKFLQPPRPARPARQIMFPPLETAVVVMLQAVRMACSAFNSTRNNCGVVYGFLIGRS